MDPFVGEIRIFGGTYAPAKWALCDGQLLLISENNALYSLLGTEYGGDGRTNFGLPDFRGRIPVGQGDGPGLSPRRIGNSFGVEYVTLDISQIPNHNHYLNASSDPAGSVAPNGLVLGNTGVNKFYEEVKPDTTITTLNGDTVQDSGENQHHLNVMPVLVLNYIICLQGKYPSRS